MLNNYFFLHFQPWFIKLFLIFINFPIKIEFYTYKNEYTKFFTIAQTFDIFFEEKIEGRPLYHFLQMHSSIINVGYNTKGFPSKKM